MITLSGALPQVTSLFSEYDIFGAFQMTLVLAGATLVGSLLIGTVLAIMRVSPIASLQAGGAIYVNVVRNTPLTLIVVACSLGLYTQLGVVLADRDSGTFIVDNNVRLAVLGLSLYHASFVCEALRSGVNTVPLGQAEAARSIGLTFRQSLSIVILPQAFRGAIAPLGNVVIALTKNTTVAATIGVAEASYVMKEMIENRPDVLFGIFAIFALGFILIVLPVGLVVTWASRRLAVTR
ncbi:glutamate ABC transporter permease [Flavimobilis marinus]|uniref:Amino acid ABC transporter membrane protein 1, PAAT family n=1 Tax=Flavimobilis marinus TaxID=285351 RepID=A0A1I2E8D0_9MICO|nr:amino acid ABC transporter permease [Flavimobilis marinus]GHG43488.1 glutamate ABC transporter permease [Flavimobilis marinus]SFE88748.1 amino acid ABC transporter membrane protein 1, PAAT family [Flavimobilis marinus]